MATKEDYIQDALREMSEERESAMKTYARTLPWNIFSERHSVFITLFFIGCLVWIGSLARIVFEATSWSITVMAWNIGMFFLFGPFLASLLFFRRILTPLLGFTIFSLTLIMAASYAFDDVTVRYMKSIPFLSLIPLSDYPLNVMASWQLLYNFAIIPITSIYTLFHPTVEIYFNENMREELLEMLRKKYGLEAPEYNDDEYDEELGLEEDDIELAEEEEATV